ncbi:MAG: iron ABC transporter permease, partial [Alphaproteobacteria bacterium]|nr:iron ABC transporter permease [Alphaproteobacteria bacterium]
IIVNLRLPRAVLGAALGATLGLSGAVTQGYLRNPLADPSLVGISSCGALGAVAAIALGLNAPPLIFSAALAGAMGATALLLALSRINASPVSFILGGMVLSALAGALVSLIISLSPNPFAIAEIMNWLMGALTDRGWNDVMLAVPLMACGCGLLVLTARGLDVLALGAETAQTLGLNLRRLQLLIIIGLGLGVGAGVAVTGVVGFVGLIVPHVMRGVFGARPGALLLPSALGGAALVLAADALVRLTPGAGEVRLGVAMALLGAPFFFALLRGREHFA